MSRRGLIGILVAEHNRQLRTNARAASEAERARLRNERELQRTAARDSREAIHSAKEAKKRYEESRVAETASLNSELAERKHALQTLLSDGLHALPPLFDTLRLT
jgi:hypothetical protein